MAEIVNLRQARKRKQAADKEARAAENRVRFGRAKADVRRRREENAKAGRHLDGKKLAGEAADGETPDGAEG